MRSQFASAGDGSMCLLYAVAPTNKPMFATRSYAVGICLDDEEGFELCSRKSKWRSRGGGEHCGFYGRCFHYSTGCKHIQTEQNHNPDIPHARVHFFLSTISKAMSNTDNSHLIPSHQTSQATLTSFPNIVMRGFIGEVIQSDVTSPTHTFLRQKRPRACSKAGLKHKETLWSYTIGFFNKF